MIIGLGSASVLHIEPENEGATIALPHPTNVLMSQGPGDEDALSIPGNEVQTTISVRLGNRR
jgi:hypothetical protein